MRTGILILSLALVSTFFAILSYATNIEVRSTLYRRREHWRVEATPEHVLCGDGDCGGGGRKSCVLACCSQDWCESVNFRPSDGHCVGVPSHIYEWGGNVAEDSDWENYSPEHNTVRDGDWILVFRAQKGIDDTTTGRMMATWSDNGRHDDGDDSLHSLSPDCFSSTETGCPKFYRSRYLDTWPSADIDQVRLSLYTGGESVVDMVFNGTGSTREDWFSASRLLSAPWDDLQGTNPVRFSLMGEHCRRFYISTTAGFAGPDCFQMYGWLIVLGKPGNACPIDKEAQYEHPTLYTTHYIAPQFLYANGSNQTNFGDQEYGKADVMAIFIKLK